MVQMHDINDEQVVGDLWEQYLTKIEDARKNEG